MVKKNSVLILSILVLLATILYGCGNKDKETNTESKEQAIQTITDPVAEYKGGTVKKADFEKFLKVQQFMNPNYEQQKDQPDFLKSQLVTYIFYKVSTENLAKPTPADDPFMQRLLTQTEGGMNKQYGANGFANRLKQFGLAKDDVLNYYLQYNNTVEYVKSKLTEADYKAEYDRQVAVNKVSRTIATLNHILISVSETDKLTRSKAEALKRAQEVLAKLKAGGKFAVLAKQYSDDASTKNNSGIYKDADVDNWVPALKKAVQDVPLNTLSEPVETKLGYHIIFVSKRSSVVKTFAEAKSSLEQPAWEKKYREVIDKEIVPSIVRSSLK
jgi:foldase protein PrsA